MREIDDKQLREFTEWYFKYFDCNETPKVYFCISMEGHLHLYEKEVKRLFQRCVSLGLVSLERGMIVKKGGAHG